ncbi:MAG: ion transporter [Lachnospiraceae bacterium]|nr:ion transporter [Lachnospiraceae bacterium]
MKVRKRIFDIIQIGSRGDRVSAACDYVIVIAIIINIAILFVSTFPLHEETRMALERIEAATVAVFIAEYVLRVWTADYLYPEEGKITSRFHFIFSFFGLVDLFSILPYFLLMLPAGMVAFRILRVIRILRLFKINAQYDAFNVIIDVLAKKRQQIYSSVCLIAIMMLASSLLMYSVEHEAQPDVFDNAFSGIWWSVSTLLTVGYGDIYPVTLWGKIFAIILSFLGVGMVAIPTGIISAGFVEQYTKMKPLDQISDSKDMSFIIINLDEEEHPWENLKIKELSLPPELVVVTVIRNGNIIIPRGDTQLMQSDEVVLGALEYQNDLDINLKEFSITEDHPWRGHHLSNISIPKDTVLVSVFRHGRSIIPSGNTMFQKGDLVTVCEKRI